MALYRPGPMANIPASCARKHGEAGEPPQPDLEWATFLKKGEKTGRAELLEANIPHLEKAARSKHERWEGLTSRGEMAL